MTATRLPPGLLAVARRELGWMWRDRVALFLAVGVPLIAFAVLSITFSNAVVRDLRVDVVDRDLTQTSMIYVQAVNAAPGVNVTRRSSDRRQPVRIALTALRDLDNLLGQDFLYDRRLTFGVKGPIGNVIGLAQSLGRLGVESAIAWVQAGQPVARVATMSIRPRLRAT